MHLRESLVIYESAYLFLTQHSMYTSSNTWSNWLCAVALVFLIITDECCLPPAAQQHSQQLMKCLLFARVAQGISCCCISSDAPCIAFTSHNDWVSICHDMAFLSHCPPLGWWLECLFLGKVKIIHRRVCSAKFTLISLAQQGSWEGYVCVDFKENLLWEISQKGRNLMNINVSIIHFQHCGGF